MIEELNKQIYAILQVYITEGKELSLQVASYIDGKLAVNCWAGDKVDSQSLFNCWSVTKGFVSTAFHILSEQQNIHYNSPIARYWPEFAKNGKAAITIRDALCHQSNIPQMPLKSRSEIANWDTICDAISSSYPLWDKSKDSYHFWTFGWIIGELIKRIDGRPLHQYIQEELCQPLGISDFYLGVPDTEISRIINLEEDFETNRFGLENQELIAQVSPSKITNAEFMNQTLIQQSSVPGCGGIMNAHAIARHYAMLANFGELDGIRLLSRERVEFIRQPQSEKWDLVLQKKYRKALGYFLGGHPDAGGDTRLGRKGGEFGCPGYSRSLGFADPERKLSFGLSKNLMNPTTSRHDSVAYKVAETIRHYIDQSL